MALITVSNDRLVIFVLHLKKYITIKINAFIHFFCFFFHVEYFNLKINLGLFKDLPEKSCFTIIMLVNIGTLFFLLFF